MKTSRKYLRKSIRRNRKLSKKKQSYKKKSHKRKNTFKRNMIKRNLKLGGSTDESRIKLGEIKEISSKIKGYRKDLWTNLEGILTKDGFTGIDDRGILYTTARGSSHPRTYGTKIEVYIENNSDRIIREHVADPPPDNISLQWEQIQKVIEELKTLMADSRKKMDELQMIYQGMPSARRPNPTPGYKSDYRPPTTPYSANPIRLAISHD